MKETPTSLQRVFGYTFARIYALYVTKIERKNRTVAELNTVIQWLTGYYAKGLKAQIKSANTLQDFFALAPGINPNATKITGLICGDRIENIKDPLMQKIRYMDKLVDELAKGKAMKKILRT
jgi:hypothetical protein